MDYKRFKKKLRKLSYVVTIYKNFSFASECILKEILYEILSESKVINPYVSVIIPFYRSSDTVLEVANRLLSLQFSFPVEFIIVDDGSDDNCSTILSKKYHNLITLIKLKSNFGPATARNVAVRFSRGQILFFLDSDQYICERSVFEETLKYLDNKTVISYLVKKENDESITWPMRFPNIITWSLGLFIPRKFYKCISLPLPENDQMVLSDWNGMNFIIRKDIFPFFEERYYGEDIDLFKRLNSQGIKNVFINKCPVIIFNKGIKAKGRLGKAKYTLFQAKIVYAKRYFKKIEKDAFLIILFSWAILASIKELLFNIPNNFFKSRFFYRLGAFALHKLWFW